MFSDLEIIMESQVQVIVYFRSFKTQKAMERNMLMYVRSWYLARLWESYFLKTKLTGIE